MTAERFTRHAALQYELMYGRGYQGPSGESVFNSLTAHLELRPGIEILDVGSGLGGDAFRLSEKYGAVVTGLDAAPDMTRICHERQEPTSGEGRTKFVTGDVRESDLLQPNSFDVIWMRDCGMYLPPADKKHVWSRLHTTLRADGRLLVTDYCKDIDTNPLGFKESAAAWHLITIPEYAKGLALAGFSDIYTEDLSADLRASMLDGRQAIVSSGMPSEESRDLLHWWNLKISSCEHGGLKWALLTASRR
ncbi:methyltransferase domain-containing protein [Streptomyces sp. NPDC058682]|uniref:methyltransferase domain-containing protein n=1 Tax=Streptomyces sp. NPDC058682 TaxID=3346596 RepID=UPI00366621BD